MTLIEYATARYVGVLKEEAKTRPLTTEEMQFLACTRALMERLRAKEAK